MSSHSSVNRGQYNATQSRWVKVKVLSGFCRRPVDNDVLQRCRGRAAWAGLFSETAGPQQRGHVVQGRSRGTRGLQSRDDDERRRADGAWPAVVRPWTIWVPRHRQTDWTTGSTTHIRRHWRRHAQFYTRSAMLTFLLTHSRRSEVLCADLCIYVHFWNDWSIVQRRWV